MEMYSGASSKTYSKRLRRSDSEENCIIMSMEKEQKAKYTRDRKTIKKIKKKNRL